MTAASLSLDFKKLFPKLTEPQLISEIEQEGIIQEVQPDDVIIREHNYIKSIPFVLNGLIKILRYDEEGNAILMYFLQPGDSCAMSMICCMGMQKSRIEAVAEDKTTLLLIPVHVMDAWMLKYPSWKAFVMETYNNRFDELLQTIDSIAFKNLDERIEFYLKKQVEAKGTKVLHISNQQIANELNSSREVISRLMGKMADAGMVKVSRSQVEVLFL